MIQYQIIEPCSMSATGYITTGPFADKDQADEHVRSGIALGYYNSATIRVVPVNPK